MALWDDFLQQVLAGVKTLATGPLAAYATEIEKDGQAFVAQAKADLETWTEQLAHGEISKDDFTFNLQADADLAKLEALTDAGVGLEALQTLRDSMINIVIDAAFKVFLP
jgi:hypothetical protein